MNDIAVEIKKDEELIKKRTEFPIDYEAGRPFEVSEQATIMGDTGEVKEFTTPTRSIEEFVAMSEAAPSITGCFDSQLEHLLETLRKIPNNPHILNNIGATYLSKGDIQNAITYFLKALDIRKDFLVARANLAKAYIRDNKFDRALAIYLEDENKYPKNSRLLMDIAHLYLQQNKRGFALEKLNALISFDPRNLAAYHTRGIIHLMDHRLNEAIADFRRALSFDERCAATYNSLGVCYILRKNYYKAIKYFTISLNIDRSDMNTLRNLAGANMQAGKFEEAARLMEEHLLTHPLDTNGRDIAAFSYLQMKDYRRSLLHLEYLIKNREQISFNGTETARILNNIGVVYAQLNNFRVAISMYKESIGLVEQNRMDIPYANLLKAYLKLGQLKEAESLVDEYMDKEPVGFVTPIVLANYYYNHDEYIKSRELANVVLRRDEKNLPSLVLLSSLYGEAFEDLDRAIEMAEKAYSLEPSNVIVVNDLVYAYLRKGRLSKARSLLGQLTSKIDYFYPYATKGLLYIMEGRLEEGITLYNKAENLAPITELKRLVRQKKHVELGRYYFSRGKLDKSERELNKAISVKTQSQIYKSQAKGLMTNIARLFK